MSKYEYKQKPFVTLWEVSEMFSSNEDLLRALQDGVLKAQGRFSTDNDMADIMHGVTEAPEDGSPVIYKYRMIKSDAWYSYKIDWENSCISMKGSTSTGLSSLVVYENVRLKRAELDLLFSSDKNVTVDKVESIKQEEQEDDIRFAVIKPIYKELEKKLSRAPKGLEVWNEIKRKANEEVLPMKVTIHDDGKTQVKYQIKWKDKLGTTYDKSFQYVRGVVSYIKAGKI